MLHIEQDIFFVAADPFSKDVIIERIKGTTADTVCGTLSEWWIRQGMPALLLTDNGPPFNSREFASSVGKWGATHQTISRVILRPTVRPADHPTP